MAEAGELFERLLALRSPLVLAEDYDFARRRQVGEFPRASRIWRSSPAHVLGAVKLSY